MTSPNSIKEGPAWVYPHQDPELCDLIVKEFKLHPLLAKIFVARNFTSIEEIHAFLYSKLPNLIDPARLSGMEKAVDRICQAIDRSEQIVIYGDNDVDGMTGTALLVEFLEIIGAKVSFYISNPRASRKHLITESLDFAKEKGCKLLITVDCGITAISQIKQVVSEGIDVIITDHHEPTDQIPYCVATLNPKLLTDSYPNRELTGVGVAFKLAHGMTNHLVSQGKITAKQVNLKRFLDLVALGTISDMGSLRGENRILVQYGLKQLHRSKRIGLSKLISVCGLEQKELTPSDIGSKIAPRLNSLGRISDPHKGVELLLIRHAQKAEEMAVEFDLNNAERQKIERTMSLDANTILSHKDSDILNNKAIILESENWHPGVIAILSTRVSKQYNRPTIIIAIDQGIGKGSLRSITQFPLLPTLKENADLLVNFGGHDFAAGLTIKKENIAEFKKRFINAANAQLAEQDILPKLLLDADIQFKDLTFDLMESLRLLEPHGQGNPPPILFCNAKQAWAPKVVGKTHLKLYLEQEDRILEGIAFGMASRARTLRKKGLSLRVAFTPQINTFHNKASIQLIIRDFDILN